MGRKRLLTLLAAMSATVVLQAAPAAAQLSLPGLGDINLGQGDDGCLQVGVDLSIGDLLALDPDVCVLGEDGDVLDVEGKVELGEQELDLGETTKPLTDAVNRSTPRQQPAPEPEPSTPQPREERSGTPQAPAAPAPDDDRDDDVAVAGGAAAFSDANPRQDQAVLLAQLQDDLARQRRADVVFGPVAPGVGDPGIAAAPQVADGLAPGVAPGVTPGVTPAPQVTSPQPERQDAILASGPTSAPVPGVPAALQLLTGAMVLAAGTVWFLARREYGGATPSAA